MSGLGVLLRQRLRRDRIQLLVWVLGFGVLASVGHSAVEQNYGSATDRAGVITLLEQTPSVLILRGTPQGTQTDAFQFMLLFAFLGVMIGLMATFLAVRHTRGDEEAGRAELVEATPAGRTTPLVATALEGVIAIIVIGLVDAAGFLLYGADVGGALLSGAALGSVGLAFLGIGLFAAQLMRTSRGANGVAASLVALAYVVRGIGDATGTVDGGDGLSMTAGWISWLSPIGWGQRTSPFSEPSVWPVLLGVALGAVAFGGALALRARRDIDSSVIPERAGRAHARASLAGPIALVWRELRNPTIGWLVAGGLFGLLVGSLSETLSGSAPADVKENIGNTVGSIAGPGAHGDLVDLFVVAMFSVIGAIAAVCAVQSVARARHDEADGTAELVLSTAVSRVRWFLAYLVIAVVSSGLVMGVAVLGALAGAAAAGAPAGSAGTIASAAVAQLPAVFLLLAIVALIFAVVPRLTIGLGWAVLLLAIFIGQFGGLFGLPDTVRDLSPFSHTPLVTDAHADWGAAWIMLALAVVVAAASAVLVRRRDVALGG